jgi:hypothetical protein
MRSDWANHYENLGLRESCVQVHLSSPIQQVPVPIRCLITPTRGLPNRNKQVVSLSAHISLYSAHRSHLHPPSHSFSLITLQSSQNTTLTHSSLFFDVMIISWHRVQHTNRPVYTKYRIHRVQHTPCTPSTQDSLSSLHSHD